MIQRPVSKPSSSSTGIVSALFGVFVIAVMMMTITATIVPAEAHYGDGTSMTTVSAINEEISLQKTVVTMSIPDDNVLPWASVKGVTSDHVKGYPIIIQFYQDEMPVHFTQVNVDDDGTYEYKFRIRSTDLATGEIINIFGGEYTVKIFNVIVNNIDKQT